jgi:ABC-type nitrate/sulfonate/bicarbonate transport system substrate-binding protein
MDRYRRFSRRALTLVACAIALFGTHASADTPAKTLLRFATPSITAQNWPHFIADARGLFAREGLDVQLIAIDPVAIVPSLIGGSVDIALAPATQLIIGIDKGASVVAVGAGADRMPYHLMVPGSIKTVKDLAGKHVAAVSPIELYTLVIKQILRKGGLDPDKDVDFVYGGGQNQRFAAVDGGAVQAGLFAAPQDTKLAERGFHALAFTPDYYRFLQLSITAVRRDWAKQNPAALRGYLRAMADASTWLNQPQNRAAAIAILMKATNVTADEAADAYTEYVRNVHDFPADYCVLKPGMSADLTMMHGTGQINGNAADIDKYVDSEWCPR